MNMKEIDITDIAGIKIGHAKNETGGTGCTVILCEDGAVAGVDVRGGGPASRETELLNPINMIESVHGIVLSGGSAFGLDAAAGVMQFLEEKGKGYDTGFAKVPIVCGASLYDLISGDPACRPDKEMGYQACCNAKAEPPAIGNEGAGTGATVGKFLGPGRCMKSGIGVFGYQAGELKVAAIVAVNALGDIIDVDLGKRIAGVLNEEKNAVLNTEELLYENFSVDKNLFSGNTTIGCVVTNAGLTKAQASKMAAVAQNGLARAIRPVHTMADGDTVFALSTGAVPVLPDAAFALGAEVMARAINRAVTAAQAAYGYPAHRDLVK